MHCSYEMDNLSNFSNQFIGIAGIPYVGKFGVGKIGGYKIKPFANFFLSLISFYDQL